MKIYLLEIDDTLTMFAVVSKKRTGFDGKNVVGVRTYDLETGLETNYQDVDGVVSIDKAREFWKSWIEYATSQNHEIKITKSIYNAKNGKHILMDFAINKAMQEFSSELIHSKNKENVQ